jgi:hypothetical protein
MKACFFIKGVIAICLLSLTIMLNAQNKISFDLAAIRNMRTEMNGLNVSCFYHFNEHIIGGIEVNRFFPVKRDVEDETVELSAWDFDCNFHYLLSLNKHWKCYPLTGFSHTSEKEISPHVDEACMTGSGRLIPAQACFGNWENGLHILNTILPGAI